MAKDRKALTVLLDGILKLSYTPKTAVLVSRNAALVNYIAHEPIQGEQRTYTRLLSSTEQISFPPVEKSVSVSYSPTRERKLIFREKEEKTQVVLELWDASRLRVAKEMKSVHQNVVDSAVFGQVAWSKNERLVAYIAERKEVKPVSFWSEETNERVGEQFNYKEHFGERHEEISNPGLFLLDTQAATVQEIKVPGEVTPAQPAFHPDSDELVFIGYASEAYKRGVAAMINRPTQLYVYNPTTQTTDLVSIPAKYAGVFYPTFSPSGRELAYYGFPPVLSHSSCATLNLLTWADKTSRTLIDVFPEPGNLFSGIYGYHEQLMKLRWVDEGRLVFQSSKACDSSVFTVNTASGDVSEVDFGLEHPWSAEILDVWQGSVLLKCSSFKTFPQVFLATFDQGNPSIQVIDPHNPVPASDTETAVFAALKSVKITKIQHRSSPVSSTLYWTTENRPLVVMIHGGPHGNSTADYTVEGTMLTMLGFNILIVNYRGSTGFGQNALEALLGHIGEMDVFDVMEAIEIARETVSTDSVVSIGGSHGGFLSAHLAGRGAVRAAVVKNGVIDVTSMNLASDITDWPSAEVLGTVTSHPPTSDHIRRFYEASPLSHSGKVNVPVLIITGGSDKRVPSFQSIELFKVLKARGQDVKMLWYPKDGHGLLTPASGYDQLLNEVIWLASKLDLK